MAEALATNAWWTYWVLTFKQRDWPDKWAQARKGVELWSKLRKRAVRAFGSLKYIQTWERHARGGYHLNLTVSSRKVFCSVEAAVDPSRWQWLRTNAEACGFGYVCWAEPMRRNSDALAGYLVKLSRELTGAGMKSQIPIDAPPHFRRIRASAKTLPPPHKSDFTGRMVFAPLECFQHGIRHPSPSIATPRA